MKFKNSCDRQNDIELECSSPEVALFNNNIWKTILNTIFDSLNIFYLQIFAPIWLVSNFKSRLIS